MFSSLRYSMGSGVGLTSISFWAQAPGVGALGANSSSIVWVRLSDRAAKLFPSRPNGCECKPPDANRIRGRPRDGRRRNEGSTDSGQHQPKRGCYSATQFPANALRKAPQEIENDCGSLPMRSRLSTGDGPATARMVAEWLWRRHQSGLRNMRGHTTFPQFS